MDARPTREEILRGTPEAPPEQRQLHAGDLDVSLVGPDLRYLRTGGDELVRRIYVAVRDRNWNTVAGRVSDFELTARERSFEVSFAVRHTDEEIDFSWRGRIEGDADGRITYALEGRAERDMEYNRAGFCVLHPVAEFAGKDFRGLTTDGETRGRLPDLIGPQGFSAGTFVPLFPSVSELETRLDSGAWLRLKFEGDLFEMEDQRNWTDASFKTYCTPLSLGFPHRLAAGETVSQRITIDLRGSRASSQRRPAPGTTAAVELVLGKAHGGLPALGLCRGDELDQGSAGLLRSLSLDHLRVDLDLSGQWQFELGAAKAEAELLGVGLELALHLRPEWLDELRSLRNELGEARVDRVLVIPAGAASATPEETTPGLLTRAVRQILPDFSIYGGTDMNFCQLNRTPPETAAMDGVFYPVVAQVHAFDDLSLVETPAAQAATVRTARSLANELPIAVSPITLRPRFNPNTTGPERKRAPDELPDSVDARQVSLLGAAWTVASLAQLAASDATSLTYYETIGWRGLLERADAERISAFPSRPGETYPVWQVFAALAGRRQARLLECDTNDPLAVACLAFASGGETRALVSNLGAQERVVSIPTGPARFRVLRLNQETFGAACAEPLDYRREGWGETASAPLRLGPFETAELAW